MNQRLPNREVNWSQRSSMPQFSDLHERRPVAERMDDPDIDSQLLVQALKGIGRINKMSAPAGPIWRTLSALATQGPIRVLDVACGGGDIAMELARKAKRLNLPITIDGCDMSPTAVAFAQESAERRRADVRFFVLDAICGSIPSGYDVIYTTLFFHHLTNAQAKQMLSDMMSAAGSTLLISDLVRCRAGLILAYFGCHLLSRSPVVHFDGPSSVAAAFTIPEFHSLAASAGLVDYTIAPKWPFRFLFTCTKASKT